MLNVGTGGPVGAAFGVVSSVGRASESEGGAVRSC